MGVPPVGVGVIVGVGEIVGVNVVVGVGCGVLQGRPVT